MMATSSSQFRRPEAAGDSQPIAWKQVPLRHCFRIISGATPSTNEPEYWDGDVVWVTPDDLGRADSRSITTSQRRITSLGAASIGQRTVPVRSLVLSTRAPIGHLGIAEVPMTTNQGCKSLAANPGVHAAYAYFQLLSRIDELRSHGTGTTFAELSRAQLARMPFWCPPIRVQQSIADYLDRETERMDALVAKKQRLIELLQEKRTALISHAVTKGLDPDAPMKDSGIEWFGRIPAHWPVVRLGHFAHVQNGSTPSRDDAACWLDGTVPWLASTKVNEDRVTSPSELVSETALRECSLTLMPAGSVIIGLVGQGRTRGMAALLDIEATINQNMAAIIPRRRIVGRHLQFQLESMYIPIREYGRGANQAALNCELVADLHLPSPPPAEQVAIARFLDERTEAIRALVDKTRRSIDLLGESRSTLITAAVTGQIDVSAR